MGPNEKLNEAYELVAKYGTDKDMLEEVRGFRDLPSPDKKTRPRKA